MSALFEEIYSRDYLEKRTRIFYDAFARNSSNIKDIFLDSFGIKYELIFGKFPYSYAVYYLLKKYYRNEYYIKKSFIKSCLLSSNSVTFTEYPINDSRADIVSINGHSTAYEIKTNYDSLNRLSKQINDYSKCFEYVFVICPQKRLKQVLNIIPSHCGIISFDESKANSSFTKCREASLSPFLSSDSLLLALTKEELLIHFGLSSRSEIMAKKSFHTINKAYKKILKIRYLEKWENCKNEFVALLKN